MGRRGQPQVQRIKTGKRTLAQHEKPISSKWLKRQEEQPEFFLYDWYVLVTNPTKSAKAAQNLDDEGYTVYLPKQQFEVIHHRTKAVMVKTVDLLKQYLFVGMPRENADWFTLRRCEGVAHPLGVDAPFSVNPGAVLNLWANEHELKFDDTREAQIKRKEIGKTMRETAKLRFAKSKMARIKVADVPFIGKIQDFNARGELIALVDMLGVERRVTVPVEDAEPIVCQDLDESGKAA
jgi:transcription antitermination factor NusG